MDYNQPESDTDVTVVSEPERILCDSFKTVSGNEINGLS